MNNDLKKQYNSIPTWAVCVFTSRESLPQLMGSIHAIFVACKHHNVCIDVLVNGSQKLCEELCNELNGAKVSAHYTIRVWFLEFGDKANAWNEYLHDIWPGAEKTFFLDGYVKVRPNALELLSDNLIDYDVLAATGIPSVGMGAKTQRQQMTRQGGLHGNLFALPRSSMRQLRKALFRLPKGIYRTDSTIGAILNFNFDPTTYSWNPARIAVNPNVTWDRDSLKWYRFKDLVVHIKRIYRQAQGKLENAAIKDHFAINKKPALELEDNVHALIENWVNRNKTQAFWMFCRSPLVYFAWLKIKAMNLKSLGQLGKPILIVSYLDN
ncbi:hypothetical protein NP590_03165 [Methylomonas sp. SURF-2]|uniref:Glycosyl transferase family 2 n=1 Tax=Methylomonas subterranea TaxID=2952225 RepID=A0ABT1TDA9_9GAMM|nr:hypothetical protein [Methylomonas sp. SURF-2]MCQ8103097.1 hypothetical protein [Methylomonas sp. SURF-2]